MHFFAKKTWAFYEIVLLKVFCLALGMILGSYLRFFVQTYLWLFVLVVILAVLRPSYVVLFRRNGV
ncbi:MAG: hypothetical protein V1784_09445 [bacterium]